LASLIGYTFLGSQALCPLSSPTQVEEKGLLTAVHDKYLMYSVRLMKDAWDIVTPATVINCFRKSGLSSGEISIGDQNINDDDLPLSEWLK
jgi:hypothetical protein